MKLVTLALAAQLTSANLGLSKSLQTSNADVDSFFFPSPNKPVEIDQSELFGKGIKNQPLEIRGFIQISPPPHQCLIISRTEELADSRICKQQVLSFSASHLAADGSINWSVATPNHEEPVYIRWPTPHRIGKAVIIGHNIDGNSFPVLILSCKNESSEAGGRKLRLQIAGRRDFVIRLPPTDQLIQPQPEPFPNLFVQNVENQKGGIPVEGVKSLFTMNEDRKKKAGNRAPDNFEDPRTLKPQPALDMIDSWKIGRRGVFEMEASYLNSNGSQPHGVAGKCRYTFQGASDDPSSGYIECQRTSEFQWLYLPLTCIHELKPH